MASSPNLLKFLRQMHLYVGVLIAPMLIFFAFTGAIQTLSLHETSSTYTPPKWVLTLAQLHKNQTVKLSQRKPKAAKPDAAAGDSAKHGPDKHSEDKAAGDKPSADKQAAAAPQQPRWKNHLPMKIFFLLVALGLLTSTLSGIYMAYKYNRSKVVVTLLLVAGIVLPLVLTAF